MRTLPARTLATVAIGVAVALSSAACGGEPTSSSVGPRPSAAGSPTATGTDGTLTDEQAAKAFFEAVLAGNQKAASRVATPQAVAVFAPWEPAPDRTFTMEDTGGVFYISSDAVPNRCVVVDAKVQKCSGGPTAAPSPTATSTATKSPSATPTNG